MQTKLALKQQEMAIIAYQLYSATYIQSMYRGWKARLLLRQLFLQRFLQIFLSFQFKFKKFRKSQICIARYYRQWIQKRKFFQVIRMCSAAIRIQRIFRKWFLLKRAIIRRIAYKTWSHIHLFGIIKAKRRIQPLERHRYVLNSFLGGYMRRKRMMR